MDEVIFRMTIVRESVKKIAWEIAEREKKTASVCSEIILQ